MRVIAPALAVLAGLIVLLGSFLPIPLLTELRALLLRWGTILAGTAALVGFYNLLAVHWRNLRAGGLQVLYSFVLILAALGTFVFVLLLGPQSPTVHTWILMGIIRPIEASLLGILAITLIYALTRLLRRRFDLLSIIFLLSAFFFLLANAPMLWGGIPFVSDFLAPWIQDIFVTAGTRGLLLGIALGALLTGLRILLTIDRPYGGK
ncbi:MAG: hypothetical protein WHS87_10885 [Anaerolineales bacterium]